MSIVGNFGLVLRIYYLLIRRVVMLLQYRCLYSLFTQNKILQGYSLRHAHGSVQLHISHYSTVMLLADLHSTLINGSIDYSLTFSQTVALHNNAAGKVNCCGW